MKDHTETEENYLKTILRFSRDQELVSTNTIANYLGTSPASVTDMLKKLKNKSKPLVDYTKYKGAKLTGEGRRIALRIIRKHRLWEVFLVEKLKFSWDNVHEVAEQLEHIDSPELIKRLDEFLEFPKFDPHGDPIPDESGEIAQRMTVLLSEVNSGKLVRIVNVVLTSTDFLQYLEHLHLTLGKKIKVLDRLSFDHSLQLEVDGKQVIINGTVAENLRVVVE